MCVSWSSGMLKEAEDEVGRKIKVCIWSTYLNAKEMRKKQSVISQFLATEKQILLPVRAGLEIRASGLNLCELSRLERFSERVIQCIQTNKYYYCNLFTYLSVGNGLLQKPVAVCVWNISMCIECTDGIIYYFWMFQSLKSQLREDSDCDIENVQV